MVSEGDHKDRVDLFPLHLTEPSVIKAREIARTGSRCDSQSFVRTPRGCLAGPVAHTRLAYQPPCSILLITVEFPGFQARRGLDSGNRSLCSVASLTTRVPPAVTHKKWLASGLLASLIHVLSLWWRRPQNWLTSMTRGVFLYNSSRSLAVMRQTGATRNRDLPSCYGSNSGAMLTGSCLQRHSIL
jgi:hypothetical protein